MVFLLHNFMFLPVRSTKEDKGIKKRGGGFNKLSSLSPQLQVITGVPELARTEVMLVLFDKSANSCNRLFA